MRLSLVIGFSIDSLYVLEHNFVGFVGVQIFEANLGLIKYDISADYHLSSSLIVEEIRFGLVVKSQKQTFGCLVV